MHRVAPLLLIPALVQAAPQAQDGREVVSLMQQRWAGRWYRSLAFSQRTRSITPDGKVTEGVWHEALQHPGLLRIDFAPISEGSGLVCTPDRIHHFRGGQQAAVQESWNHLLILIGDIYCQPVARSIFQLEKLGFDLGRVHRADWQGGPCWVVGAEAGDPLANQFWIDCEQLLLRRVIRKDPSDSKAMRREVQIVEYRQVDGFPIAAKLHFLD